MVLNSEKLPRIKLKGSPEEIGYQHGRLLADRISACYNFYTVTLFNKPDFDYAWYGERYLRIIDEFAPEYRWEIEALARGADMRPWQIAVLNARTEIFLKTNPELINECTVLSFRRSRLLGQNWDWMMACEDLIVLMELERPDGFRILMMTEPGIIGKIGFNSAGLGVCLNILFGREEVEGVPIHILLRAILDAPNLEAARTKLASAERGTFSNVLIADANGNALDLEFFGREMEEISFTNKIPIHTNHYLTDEKRDDKNNIADSRKRYRRALELSGSVEGESLAEMKGILLDKANGEEAICKEYAEYAELLEGVDFGTVCSLVMDLSRCLMHITRGNPCQAPFETFALQPG